MPPRRKRYPKARPEKVFASNTRSSARSRTPARPSIHSLPFDVLQEIFIRALPTTQEILESIPPCLNLKRHILLYPLILCAVCSSWRTFAFAVPQLWTRVFISLPLDLKRSPEQAGKRAAGLVQWIELARSLPLTLHAFYRHSNEMGPENLHIMSVFDDYADRWESMYYPFPLLSVLQLNTWTSLRGVYLFCQWRYGDMNQNIPWHQLTHLRVPSCLPDLRPFISKCLKLEHLSVFVDQRPTQMTVVPMTFRNLISLAVEDRICMGYRRNTILHQLCLPSLREISFKARFSDGTESLLGLLTRSSCALDKLEIYGSRIAPNACLNILAHSSCKSLTSLVMGSILPDGGAPVDKEILRRLTLHQTDTVCPHLKNLRIDYCVPGYLLPEFLSMVESRIGSHDSNETTLRHVQFHVLLAHFKYFKSSTARLGKMGERGRMEYYIRQKCGCRLVSFQRRDDHDEIA